MDEKEIMIDPCYIIAIALMYKKSLNGEFFSRIQKELSKEYDVDLSLNNVIESVYEWKDFFRLTNDGRVIFTEYSIKNKFYIEYLFCNALEDEVYKKVVDVILNKKPNKEKTIVFRFPK